MNLTFKQIVDRTLEGNLTPDEIIEFRNFCAGWLYRLNEKYGKLVAAGAVWQAQNRKEYKSQAECERQWESLEAGQMEIKLKYEIRGIEALNDSLVTAHFAVQRELKEAARGGGI